MSLVLAGWSLAASASASLILASKARLSSFLAGSAIWRLSMRRLLFMPDICLLKGVSSSARTGLGTQKARAARRGRRVLSFIRGWLGTLTRLVPGTSHLSNAGNQIFLSQISPPARPKGKGRSWRRGSFGAQGGNPAPAQGQASGQPGPKNAADQQ